MASVGAPPVSVIVPSSVCLSQFSQLAIPFRASSPGKQAGQHLSCCSILCRPLSTEHDQVTAIGHILSWIPVGLSNCKCVADSSIGFWDHANGCITLSIIVDL